MNRIEEPYFSKPQTNVLENKASPPSSSSFIDDTTSSSNNPNMSSDMDFKNILIILLIFFLVVSFFGISLWNNLGNLLQSISDIFQPIINHFLHAFGYSAGTALNAVSDVTADVAKGGIDIMDGAVNNFGDLLIGDNTHKLGDNTHKLGDKPNQAPIPIAPPPPPPNTPTEPPEEPSPDTSENAIQKPISSDKWNWCLVGEYQNKRGCIEITDSDKCMSGQVFPSQKMCLNPTWSA